MKVMIGINCFLEMPFKRKPKDDDDTGKEGTKPKIVRGLGGGAECKS